MKKWIAGLAVSAMVTNAHANSWGTDATDLWWNPSESGWGVNVNAQGDTLFLTFFVYDQAGQPHWYVASSVRYASTSANGDLNFIGPLYQTSGPWFGGNFNPEAVGAQVVGSVTFAATTVNTAVLTYTINGVAVTKQVERQTWKINDATGNYIGASIGTYTGSCGGTTGYAEEPGTFSISQGAGTMSVTVTSVATGVRCTYSGVYQQAGRMGAFSGTASCTNGSTAIVQVYEIEANPQGFTARGTAQFPGGCSWTGHLGGLSRRP